MGAWGYQSFENDDALDWVANLKSSFDLALIDATLNDVIDNSADFLDARECARAIAASEVLAALHGNPSPLLPDEVREWISGKFAPDRALNQKAQQALDRILADSELRELWEENTTDYPNWIAAIEQIKSRLP